MDSITSYSITISIEKYFKFIEIPLKIIIGCLTLIKEFFFHIYILLSMPECNEKKFRGKLTFMNEHQQAHY
jgi:hypothetical protein